jgi:plasmid stabilization system protein ParE
VRPRNLSPRALRDIDKAVDDIAASVAGPAFANQFAVAVADAAERVARRPLLGHRRLELLPPRFRFWAVKGFDYLLVYNAEHKDRPCELFTWLGILRPCSQTSRRCRTAEPRGGGSPWAESRQLTAILDTVRGRLGIGRAE